MAFEGDLSNLSLGDVLQTIAMSRQVGTFVIRGVEERRLGCGPQGIALLSTRTSLGLRIGRVLVGSGKVTQDQLDQALKVQRRRRETLVGQILVEQQSCTSDDVRTARRYLAAEEIFDLFLWKQGTFEFLAGEGENAGPFADLWFDVGSLAMEAARRLDEMPRAVEKAPAEEVFVPEEVESPSRANAQANRDLWAVYELCDGSRTVEDVHEAHYRGRFDTWKALETLLEWKLLRPATKEEIVAAADAASHKRDFVRASRLYRRASEHDPADDSVRQSVADALRDSGDKRGASEQLVLVGRSRLAAGKGLPAVEAFRQAISLDANNADAHEGLMASLAESGQVDDAAAAGNAAAALRISLGDYAGACRVAEQGLAQKPGDAQLLIHLANANQGLGRSADAVRLLDDVAQMLEGEDVGDGDRRLLDVYRRIVQVDPERKDAARRVEEIQEYERTRRKRLMQRVAMAAGVAVLGCVGLVVFKKPPVGKLIDEARAILDAKGVDAKAAESAQILVKEIEQRKLSDDEQIDVNGLKARIKAVLSPPDETLRKGLDGAIDVAANAATKAVAEERVCDGLELLASLLDVLDRADARKLKALDPQAAEKLRAEAVHEVQNALGQAANAAQKVAARVTAMRDRFADENIWKKEDLDVLHDLVTQSGLILQSTKVETWTKVATLEAALEKRAHLPPESSDKKKLLDAASGLVEACKELATGHDRALSRARRKELKEAFVTTYAAGTQAERDGRLSDALDRYDAFLAKCDELKNAQPEKFFGPIRKELFGSEMQLDGKISRARDGLAAIVRDEDDALKAESAGDCETAFHVRKRLVLDHRDIDFSRRFRMPLRVETAPPGAEVFLIDGAGNAQDLGATPTTTNYPIDGGAKFEVRLAGYKSSTIVRKGAVEDASGVERIELAKLAKWTSAPGGFTEAAPTSGGGAIYVVSRTGAVRHIDSKTGEEKRFEPRLMDGFAGSAALYRDRVIVASIDGKGFVLAAADLAQIATFDTGSVRGSPLATARGVLVCDEAGDARLVDETGRVVWKKPIGKVRVAPASAADRAFVVTSEGEALLLDVGTGEVVRRRTLKGDSPWGAPTVRGNRAFVANDLGEVICLDVSSPSLAEMWSRRLDGRPCGRISAGDLRLLVSTAAGAVHALDVENGAVISRTLVGGKLDDNQAPCELPDGGFVIATKKGLATRFDAKGEVVWRFDAGEDVAAAPRLVEGLILLVTRKGVVIALVP